MKIDIFFKKRVIVIYFAIFTVGSVAFGSRVFSFNNTITHPMLTDKVASVYNSNFERKLTDQEINWIKKGSIDEDFAFRPLYHFFDPNTGSGMAGAINSKVWAQDSNRQMLSMTGDFSWNKAIKEFAKGKNKEAFIALGHVLHLLEDKAVPAHTRLDEHLMQGDPYEGWAIGQANANLSSVPIIVTSLDGAFDGLANYSNRNFLSKDTIDIEKIKNLKTETIFEENKSIDCFVSYDGDGNKFCIISSDKNFLDYQKRNYYLVNKNHFDYFSLLAPKAVSYGAGAVKLFFDEAEKAKKEYEQKNWWQKLKEKTNGWRQSVSGFSLYAGIGISENAPSDASGANGSESPGQETVLLPTPILAPLPPNTVEAREKIFVNLPPGTIVAEEKLGGNIAEEVNPQDAEIPPAITEEITPEQASSPSPSPMAFLPGMGGPTPTPTPTPSSGPDTTEPETTITSGPANSIATTTATFEFSSSESSSTFSCQLDNASSTVCASPKEYISLSEASHNFKVNATDAAGNTDATPAEQTWTVDLTAPQLTSIASSTTRSTALISWTASEAGIFQVEYGTSTSYDLITATTSAVSLSINSLTASTTYHWRLLAQDSLGNSTSTADNIFTTTNQAESVVISEIKTAGDGGANDEWIELYNPTSQAVDISGWSIQYRGSASVAFNKKNFTSTSSITAFGFFLITNSSGYQGGVSADMPQATFSLSATGGNVFLVSNQDLLDSATSSTIIDKLSYGAGSYLFPEGEVFSSAPSAVQSLERKANATSTAALLVNGAHQWQGNGYDSDNNFQDFVLQNNPNPQNSLMLTEPRASVPGLMASSAWPTWQGNLARSGQTAAAALATSTLAVKWIATTTATHEFASRPTLDSENNIYIGRVDGLAKYSSSGNLIWLTATDEISAASPLIVSDGTIYYRGSGGLFAVSQNGQLKWKYVLSETSGNYAALAILSDGAIITQSAEKIYAINQDATLKWFFDPGRALGTSNSIGAFVVDATDNVYATVDKYIYALNKDGVKIWEKNYGASYTSLSLAADNTLYVAAASWFPGPFGAYQGGFYALNTVDGAIKWSDVNSFNDHAELAAAIDSSGKAYPIVFYGGAWVSAIKLQSYNASSTPSWASVNLGPYLAAPIITSDGKIYLADQNLLKVFDAASGALDRSFDSGDNLFYSYFAAVGSDGTIYTASSNAFGGTLYAIGSRG